MFKQITDKSILRVLISGFALVIVLLLVSGYVGVHNAQQIRTAAEKLAGEQVVTNRLIDEIHREQGALNAVFTNLSQEPDSVDRDQILSQLNEADRVIEQIVATGSGTKDEPLWKQLRAAATAFSAEARRLLAVEDAESLFSYDLLERHEQVIEIVRKLIASGTERSTLAQGELTQKSARLVNQSMILMGACLTLALIVAIFTVRVTAQLSRRLEWQAGELSRVSWHMLENQESAARRFSHELHDELGQSLTAVKANLVALAQPESNRRFEDCLRLVDEAIKNVRELSQLLRPTILDDFGLDAGLRWQCERFHERTGIDVKYDSSISVRLPDETETHLFRIAQEALTNIARHAHATRVEMTLHKDDGKVRLRISDNGKGIDEGERSARRGIGMTGMRARARSAGGELEILTPAGDKGLTIEAWVPADPMKDEQEDTSLIGR
ncbi:MAG: MCP four helix bundle domain-containing protein [Acidobacteria bacterium]|nr:MCP four helix bundle domain-containing protein [Acidobacteriota bacterium]